VEVHHSRRRRDLRTFLLYARTLVATFRRTFLAVILLVAIGTALYVKTPHAQLGGHPPTLRLSLYCAWMALFAQPILSPPETWYLELMSAIYPLFGFVLVGEGIVRLSLLLLSRERGERDWMKVIASTYRDHVVLCGLGHLGSRILDQLVAAGVPVVAMEKDPQARFLPEAKATGAPILICDMKAEQSLREAGVPHARCIIIGSDDDFANLEVALDARRLNPRIKILMRLFDQQIADKIRDAFSIDQAFSPVALAAPLVAAMSHEGSVLASFPVGGVAHLTHEVGVADGSALVGLGAGEVETKYEVRVLAHLRGGHVVDEKAAAKVTAGDELVVHAASDRVTRVVAVARAAARAAG
jgi:Trk K+ transport system NAD-binding subunit